METLLLIPTDETVLFPGTTATFPAEVGDEERILLVPRHDGEFADVGTVAEVIETVRLPGGIRAVTVSGLHRGRAGAASTAPDGTLRVEVTSYPDSTERTEAIVELEREYRAVVEEILELRGADGRIRAFLRSIDEPGALADTSGYSPDLTYEQKLELLQDDRRRGAPAQGPRHAA